ncbi:MAG: M12 family metallo-peptidase [Chloroflexota bacterium]
MHRIRLIFTALLLLLGLPMLSSVQTVRGGTPTPPAANPLFSDPVTGPKFTVATPPSIVQRSNVIRSRYTTINFTAARDSSGPAQTITLNLFSDTTITATYKNSQRNATDPRGTVWVGTVDGVPYSEVVLTIGNGVMNGAINVGGHLYEIDPVSGATHAILEIDVTKMPPEAQPLVPPTSTRPAKPSITAIPDDGTVIDVMVIFTPQALAAVGGSTATMLNNIAGAVALANQGYLNSGVRQRLRLVYAGPTTYDETGSTFDTDLARLTNPSDGFMDEIPPLRAAYGADLVSLGIANTDYCGLAWLMTNVSTSFASNGYSAVSVGCYTYYSMAHEMGHNMGSNHDHTNASGGGAFSYSYGFRDETGGTFRTIMAYAGCPSTCLRVNFWSNPSVTYGGLAMGDGVSNNALSLNNTANVVSNFSAPHTAGHGEDTIGIFRPSTTGFYLRYSNTTGVANLSTTLGASTDLPIVGDWNGDGIDTVGVFRPSTAQFFLTNSNAPGATIAYAFTLGVPGDTPIAGDWNNNGSDGVGIFRPSNGLIYLKNALTTGFADFTMVLGTPGDVGVAGDWDANGVASPGVYRPSNSTFYLTNSVCNCSKVADYTLTLGVSGDVPMAGDWNADKFAGVGVFRPTNGLIYLRNTLTTGFADTTITFGIANDKPVAGQWGQSNFDSSVSASSLPKVAPTFVP